MLSVVIPAARSLTLRETIKSIRSGVQKHFEIIVIDNAVRPAESQKIRTISEEMGTRYIREPNEGLHNARNRGLLISEAEIVVYVDDDVLVRENYLEEITKPFRMFEKVGVVGGKVIPRFEAEFVFPPYARFLRYQYLSLLDYGNEIKEVPSVNGNSMAVLKSAALEVGGFNPDKFQSPPKIWKRGDGESGLQRKLKRRGWKIIYTPHAVAEHLLPKDALSIERLKRYAFRHGIQMSYSKFFGGCFPSRTTLLLRSVAFFVLYLSNKMASRLIPYPRGARYEVQAELFKARAMYELKLTYDSELRANVSKTNWIAELLEDRS